MFICLEHTRKNRYMCGNNNSSLETYKCIYICIYISIYIYIYILSSVCLRLKKLSQLSFMPYMGMGIFRSACDDCCDKFTLSYYYHHQIGSVNHESYFMVRSRQWNALFLCPRVSTYLNVIDRESIFLTKVSKVGFYVEIAPLLCSQQSSGAIYI